MLGGTKSVQNKREPNYKPPPLLVMENLSRESIQLKWKILFVKKKKLYTCNKNRVAYSMDYVFVQLKEINNVQGLSFIPTLATKIGLHIQWSLFMYVNTSKITTG
jgi:hypothetical protein